MGGVAGDGGGGVDYTTSTTAPIRRCGPPLGCGCGPNRFRFRVACQQQTLGPWAWCTLHLRGLGCTGWGARVHFGQAVHCAKQTDHHKHRVRAQRARFLGKCPLVVVVADLANPSQHMPPPLPPLPPCAHSLVPATVPVPRAPTSENGVACLHVARQAQWRGRRSEGDMGGFGPICRRLLR